MDNWRLCIILLAVPLATAGCIGTDGDEEAGPTATDDTNIDAPDTGNIASTLFEGSIQISAATPARSFNYGGEFFTTAEPRENTTGYVLELVWDATTPASEELDLWVRLEAAGNVPPSSIEEFNAEPVATATGTSPLTLTVSADQLEVGTTYELIVRAPGPAGVAAEQPFELHVTEFLDVPLDESYSALDQ